MKRCRVTDIQAGTFTCDACPNGYVDDDPSRPGRICTASNSAVVPAEKLFHFNNFQELSHAQIKKQTIVMSTLTVKEYQENHWNTLVFVEKVILTYPVTSLTSPVENAIQVNFLIDSFEMGFLYQVVIISVVNPCNDPKLNDCDTNADCRDLKNNKYNCTCRNEFRDKSPDSTKPGRVCVPSNNEK